MMAMTTEAGRPSPPSSNRLGPEPTWDEFARLVAALKAGSRPWVGCRFFAFFAVVILARLKLTEAAPLAAADLISEGDKLHLEVARRGGLKQSGDRFRVPVGPVLRAIVERWRARETGRYLFPNQSKEGPYRPFASNKGATAIHQIRASCQAAGVPYFTISGLARFAEANVARLADPAISPFVLGPGDMEPREATILQFHQEVWSYYGPSQPTCLNQTRLAFSTLERIGVETTSDLRSPNLIDRFAAATGVSLDGAGKKHYMVTRLHAIICHAIRFGYLDDDPFRGRPGFSTRGMWRKLDRSDRAGGWKVPNRRPRRPAAEQLEAELAKLTPKQAKVARALIAAEANDPPGLIGAEIRNAANIPGWWKILKAIKESGPFWADRVLFPEQGGTRYRIKIN